MSQGKTPEYKVLRINRPKLEGYVKDHITRIAGQLEANNILTQDQYEDDIVTGDPKQGARNLLGIILRSVEDEEDSRTFAYFLDVLLNVGNTGLQRFAGKIEDDRKKLYRDLFPDVSGSEKELIDVFISYGHGQETNAFVKDLEARLTQSGLKVFMDRSDIAPGDVWPDKLASALYSCKAFVAVLTKKYVQSHYCNGELYQAEAQKKQLIPVVFEDGWDSEMSGASVKSVVQSNQYAFFRKDRDDFEKQFSALINNIRKLTGITGPSAGSTDSDAKLTSSPTDHDSRRERQDEDVGPTVLNVKTHLKQVKRAIREARADWKNIGRGLDLSEGDIKSIHEDDDEERLHKVLSLWMQTGNATIYQLLEALENPPVSRKDIAGEIRRRTGEERRKVGL